MRAVSLLFHDVYVRQTGESGFRSAAADRYKLPIAAFDAQLRSIAIVRRDDPELASCTRQHLPSGADRSATNDPPFTITVDDGGVSYHSILADRLERYGWRGHCFVTTNLIGTPGFLSAAQIRELDARGHVIGSHSASHPARFSACTPAQMLCEWSRSRQVLEDVLGHPVVVASVPGGYFSTAVANAAADAGLRILFTSEPITSIRHHRHCALIGRFAIRRADSSDFAGRLVARGPLARAGAWATWRAKGVVKPVLGSQYAQLADWMLARRVLDRTS